MMSDLMTLEDIAALWQVNRGYAQRYLVKRAGFPDPIPGSTRKCPRWRARDVRALIEETPTKTPTQE